MKIECPEDFHKLKKIIINKVEYYVKMAEDKLQVAIPMPVIDFSIRGTTAGRAYYNENRIRFNADIVYLNPDEFIERTPGHEVAHLVAHKINPACSPHGSDWKRVMCKFNLPPIRCHSYRTEYDQPKRKEPLTYKDKDMNVRFVPGGKIIEFD